MPMDDDGNAVAVPVRKGCTRCALIASLDVRWSFSWRCLASPIEGWYTVLYLKEIERTFYRKEKEEMFGGGYTKILQLTLRSWRRHKN